MFEPVSLTDARGRTIRIESAPGRIISLVPSLTELLAHLGLDEEVAGITRFCTHPSDWRTRKVIIGGTKNVRIDRVRKIKPDLVLANLEENVRLDVDRLDELAPVFVTDIADLEDTLAAIHMIGHLIGRVAAATALAEEIAARFASIQDVRPLRAVYLIWREPYMTIGGDTFIHDMLRRGGFTNVFAGQVRYPEVTPYEITAAEPDIILLSSEPFPFGEKHVAEIRTFFPDTPVHLVDGAAFSWYGSRLLDTPSYLVQLRRVITEASIR